MGVFLASLSLFSAGFLTSGAKVGEPAPPFSGTTIDGKELHLSDYRGRVVLLDFWASWCGPCREEMPFLIDLHQTHKRSGFEVIAVNIDDDIKNAKDFLSNLKRRVAFPIVVDPTKQLPQLYEIRAMPTSLIIDKNGVVRFWHDGFKNSHRSRIQDELKSLLDKE